MGVKFRKRMDIKSCIDPLYIMKYGEASLRFVEYCFYLLKLEVGIYNYDFLT